MTGASDKRMIAAISLPARRRPRLTRRPSIGALFVSPAALIVAVFFLLPLGVLFYMSFQKWPLLGSPTPGGLTNYAAIGQDQLFLDSIVFTLFYTVVTAVIIFGVAFGLVAISNSPRRGARFYRTAFFLPYVVGTASAALIWYASTNDQNGIANDILEKLGLSHGPWGFISTAPQAFLTVMSLVVWKFVGFQVLVLLVGLQSVPGELYEAARMDGANTWQRLRYITVPFMKSTMALLLILGITGSLLAFDQFFVLTKGGPDNSTVTMVFAIYETAFQKFDLGGAAALSVVVLLALVVINGLQFLVLRRRGESQ